jgi:hypothetical protein
MARDWSGQQYDDGDDFGFRVDLQAVPEGYGPAMIDFLEQTIRGLALFGQEALSGGNIWILMLIVVIAIGVVASVRGKLTEGWLWIPILALAMWYAVYRWLELRA